MQITLRKTLLLTAALCVSMSVSMSAMADEVQDNFLKDMAEGLNARWDYETNEDTLSSSEIMEYRTSLVNEEYSRLGKYAEEKFESEKFGLMAYAYIEAIELQLNAIKYYTELPSIYEAEWTTGYNLRAALIPEFADNYGLDVPEEEIAVFRSGNEVASDAENETLDDIETSAAESQSPNNQTTGIELFNDEGIKVTITGMEEPNLNSTKINVSIENLNHHDILVSTANSQAVANGQMVPALLWAEVQSGKTSNTTIEFFETDLEAAGIDKINEISFTIQIIDGESFLPLYEGDEKFLVIDDNYQISEKEVYTDTESIQRVQTLLNEAGYDCGVADGVPGKQTNNALLQFERDHGLPETTDITPELIETLEAAIN